MGVCLGVCVGVRMHACVHCKRTVESSLMLSGCTPLTMKVTVFVSVHVLSGFIMVLL